MARRPTASASDTASASTNPMTANVVTVTASHVGQPRRCNRPRVGCAAIVSTSARKTGPSRSAKARMPAIETAAAAVPSSTTTPRGIPGAKAACRGPDVTPGSVGSPGPANVIPWG